MKDTINNLIREEINKLRNLVEESMLFNSPIIYSEKENRFLEHKENCLGVATGCNCEISNVYKKVFMKQRTQKTHWFCKMFWHKRGFWWNHYCYRCKKYI